jgi:putative transposase
MVRAGVVKHHAEWPHSGYLAIQQPPKRYRVVDLLARRDDRWSESIAVGSEGFVEKVKNESGFRAQHRGRFVYSLSRLWRSVSIGKMRL